MQQLVNHNSQQSSFTVTKFPIHWNKYGQLRYWVEHNVKKKNDRLFIQLHDGGVWAAPKHKETSDIVLLLQDDNEDSANCGLVFPLLWDVNCKQVDEIVDFAEQYEFNNLQKTVIMKALASLGYTSAPMWLQGDVIDLAIPVTALSAALAKKEDALREKVWRMIGKGIPPHEKKAKETAHFIHHGNLAERGPVYEPVWAAAQALYDSLFDSVNLRAMGVSAEFIANLENVIRSVTDTPPVR